MTSASITRDAQVQQDVIQELKWDTRVDETEVGVQIDQGIVMLTGAVDSYAKRLAAQEAAHRVARVLDVANDLVVRLPGSPGRTDTEIAQAVRYALEWDALVPHEQIASTVAGGVVTLDGTVRTWSQRDDAARVVSRLVGVCNIVNNIQVTPHPAETDQVRQAIKEALARQAVRDAERIRVLVQDGRVILSGKVRSWSAKQAVLNAAAHALGIGQVEDALRIEPIA